MRVQQHIIFLYNRYSVDRWLNCWDNFEYRWISVGMSEWKFWDQFFQFVHIFYYYLFYFYELYPSQIRVLGISLIILTSGITLAVTQLIIDKSIQSGFSVMIVFCIFAAASIVASLFLPETYLMKPMDMIK